MLLNVPIINDFGNILNVLWSVFDTILNMISSVSEAMMTFYNMLVSFNNDVLLMVSDASAGKVSGLPINEAIGTFRYLVGDPAFYTLYLIILFGCLMTILKLIYLILDAWTSMNTNSAGTTAFKTGLGNLLRKLMK